MQEAADSGARRRPGGGGGSTSRLTGIGASGSSTSPEADLFTLLTSLVFAAPASAEDGIPPAALRAWRLRAYRRSANLLGAALEAQPDDPELAVMAAVNWARAGFYADALGLFRLCVGGETYEAFGLDQHADALLYTGHPQQAAELRESQRVMVRDEGEELTVLMSLISDQLYAGELGAAEDSAWQALSLFPRSSAAHAWLSEVLRAGGQEEDADFHLWMARRDPDMRSMQSGLAEMRVLTALEDYKEADRLGDNARDAYPRSVKLLAVRSELARVQGLPQDALRLVDLPAWTFNGRPELDAVEAMALVDLGELDEARRILDDAEAVCPQDPDLRRARAYLEAASSR